MEKNNGISITDNYVAKREFNTLRERIMQEDFPWFFMPIIVNRGEKSPGVFIHKVHENSDLSSPFYDTLRNSNILEQLMCAVLLRITINLNPIHQEPYFTDFHSDTITGLGEAAAAQWTTSIFYINTNNGYTELESGEKIESIANRLVTFPSNVKHRGVTQTDEQRRILINFNYLDISLNIILTGENCINGESNFGNIAY